jgi:hypothetical protein
MTAKPEMRLYYEIKANNDTYQKIGRNVLMGKQVGQLESVVLDK